MNTRLPDEDEAAELRADIERLNVELATRFNRRETLIRVQAATGLSTREIARFWAISQPRVVDILNPDLYKAKKQRVYTRGRKPSAEGEETK